MGNQRHRQTRSADPSAGLRALRLELLFREELNSILDGELGDERFSGVYVTLVEMSRDGSRARIWYAMTTIHDVARVTQTKLAFDHAAPFFRARLCEALPLKRMPELSFRHDPAFLGSPSAELTPETE
jgi:ribosome-binding factor A